MWLAWFGRWKEIEDVRVEVAPADYQLAEDDDIAGLLLGRWGEFGFDTETTSPVRAGVFATDEADLVGFSVSVAPRTGFYVPVDRLASGTAAICSSPLWIKVCHNVWMGSTVGFLRLLCGVVV